MESIDPKYIVITILGIGAISPRVGFFLLTAYFLLKPWVNSLL